MLLAQIASAGVSLALLLMNLGFIISDDGGNIFAPTHSAFCSLLELITNFLACNLSSRTLLIGITQPHSGKFWQTAIAGIAHRFIRRIFSVNLWRLYLMKRFNMPSSCKSVPNCFPPCEPIPALPAFRCQA